MEEKVFTLRASWSLRKDGERGGFSFILFTPSPDPWAFFFKCNHSSGFWI